jgi:GTPase SAR1 family protein
MAPEDITRIGRFRILVIGNANAGKTTILEKVCRAKGREPEVLGATVRHTLADRRLPSLTNSCFSLHRT